MSTAASPHLTPLGSGKVLTTWMESQRIASDRHKRCFLALQPIFDREGSVFGYEALCRTGRKNHFTGDPRVATHNIIRDWLLDGLYRFTGRTPVFLNCTREDLLRGFVTLPPVPVVIEVLETVEADEWVVSFCRKLKSFGHQIALDDFQLSGSHRSLVELADFIKIDFRACDKEQRKMILRSLRERPIQFVAEKIETREEFEAALDEGFDLLQGYYLARPVLLSRERTWVSLLNHFRLQWLSRTSRRRWKRPVR